MNKIVALLPMKLKSERIENKNFKNFNGKPLFMWMLENLLSIKIIDLIVINTDAKPKIISHGVDESSRLVIRNRSNEICGNNVSMNKIINDDINFIKSEFYIMTHTTNPLLSSKTILNAISVYKKHIISKKNDSLFSVNKIQTRLYDEKLIPINHNHSNLIPTQSMKTIYEENSNLYCFTEKSFNYKKNRIGKTPCIIETPVLESIDIDNNDDWALAEIIHKYNR